MTGLERRLVDLGAGLDLPAERDLWPAVRARLAEPAPRRRRFRPRSRRALVLAFAALALALGAALAVPPARTAILEWLGLRGVEVRRVPELPPAPPPAGADLGLGRRVTLAEARGRAAYRILVPALEPWDRPGEIWFTRSLPGGQVAFVYVRPGGGRLLLTQFQADPGFRFVEKLLGPGTRLEPVVVGGEPGYWIEGEPHFFLFVDPAGEVREETLRLAGDTLLWQAGGLTLRLEGARTKAEALAIARSMR